MTDPLTATMELLEKRSPDRWEVFSQWSDSFRVEVKDGKVDSLHKARSSGLAVRVIHDNRVGFSFSAAMDVQSLRDTVDSAVNMVRFMPADPDEELPPRSVFVDLDGALLDGSLGQWSERRKTELAQNIESAARGYDRRIATVRSAGYSDTVTRLHLVNSRGLDVSGIAGMGYAWVQLMAEEGSHQESGYWMDQARSPQSIDPEAVGATAAKRAVASLGGDTIPSSAMPAIFENTIAADLLRILSVSFLGESHFKKRASPRIQPGLKVFSEKVSIVDDALDPGGTQAFAFDGEGTPARTTLVVDRGTVDSLLFDGYHARKLGKSSTGNCRRTGYETPPSSGVSNMLMKGGTISAQALVGMVDRGLLVTELMGLHTANPVSGDFSVGAAGFLIEQGQVSRAVKGIAVAGNIMDLFARVIEVAGDFRFFGNYGAASFLVDSLAVSGS